MNISNKKAIRSGEYVEVTPTVYRTATAISLERVSFVGKTATVAILVKHYQDAERTLPDDTFQDQVVNLVIDNTEPFVDRRSGQYATEETPEEFVKGEFDFFETQKLGSIQEMIQMGILRADLQFNRFD